MIKDEQQLQHSIPEFDLDRLEVVTQLGRGAKGVVFLARDKSNDDVLALKVISRDSIEKKSYNKEVKISNPYRRVNFEQAALRKFNHPLLPRLRGVLATDKVIGYAIDYCSGRDLNYLRWKQSHKIFSEDAIRFYAAELILALEYLHNLGIVYRDLKPENIMIQENGHIMLIDFDLSTELRKSSTPLNSVDVMWPESAKKKRLFPFQRFCDSGITPDDSATQDRVNSERTESDSFLKSKSLVGTAEYVAPEIVSGNGHDFAVDCWSLGILLYEMLYGTTPFKGTSREETFDLIVNESPDLVGQSTSLRDLIGKLLEKDPRKRITIEGVKAHDFFKGMNWELILQIQRPPNVPSQSDEIWKEGNEKIDVELYVQGIFGSDDSGKKSNKDKRDLNVWRKGRNRHRFDVNRFSFS